MAGHLKNYDEAVKMYEAGLSLADVGAYFGKTRQGMWDILKRRGVKMRSNLRFGKANHFHRGTRANDHAQNLLEVAIRKGIVTRKSRCEICGKSPTFKDGRTGVQAHHPDYNRPLDVMWLCQRCHHEWHRKNRAVPLREGR